MTRSLAVLPTGSGKTIIASLSRRTEIPKDLTKGDASLLIDTLLHAKEGTPASAAITGEVV